MAEELGWEKQQRETREKEAREEKGRQDRAAGRYAQSGEDPRTYPHSDYMKGYGK